MLTRRGKGRTKTTPSAPSEARRLPQFSEVRDFVLPALRRHPGAALARIRTTTDFQRLARRRAPRAVYDYVDGSAEEGLSADRAVQAFQSVSFLPHVLRDVSTPDCSSSVLGRPVSMPMVMGPTGFTRMMHASGEIAVARAASRHNLPYVLSTMGTTSIEELASHVPDADRWFQLYVWQDRERSLALVEQAQAAGYTTLVVTVDVPVAGARHRDVYNGLTIPPSLTPRTLLNMATKPSWVFDSLTTRPLKFDVLGGDEPLATQINRVFDSASPLPTLNGCVPCGPVRWS